MISRPSLNRNFWHGKRVLLTGHTGFKGSWLGLWLTELGAEVTGVSLNPNNEQKLFEQLNLKQRLAKHYIKDIRDEIALKAIVENTQPDVVFHLAAQPLVRRSYADPLGTWATNVQGSLNLLEALKPLQKTCAGVFVTTDKVYENREWEYGYRESDRLGGHDPYSASKAAAEIAIASWRSSYCGDDQLQNPHLRIATARAGNVIGGGDWAEDRIVPDVVRALAAKKPVAVRNPKATRPWQHVLEPLSGYLLLAECMSIMPDTRMYSHAFNFGPNLEANKNVESLLREIFKHWEGTWEDQSDPKGPHEANRLHLQIDKAFHELGWRPRWNFKTTVEKTVNWYRSTELGGSALKNCLDDIATYQDTKDNNKQIR